MAFARHLRRSTLDFYGKAEAVSQREDLKLWVLFFCLFKPSVLCDFFFFLHETNGDAFHRVLSSAR